MAKEIARKYFIPKRRFYPRKKRLLARFRPSNKGVEAHPMIIRGNMITAMDGFFQVRKPTLPLWVEKIKESFLDKQKEEQPYQPKGFLSKFMHQVRESHPWISSRLTYAHMLPVLQWLIEQEEYHA